jgi:formate--tetrahydrofolate ligase
MENSLLPIQEIAAKMGLSEDDLEPYGRYTAKVKLNRLPPPNVPPNGKLILVTAMTPTSHGEGKTVVSIGLAQALQKLGKRSVVTLREPSLGPVFGIKGGATGGGRSQVLPSEKINLHFNGDKHAVAAAHNLLAAMIDSHVYHGNELRIDLDNISWPRTIDMNDRALRNVTVGL